MRATEISKYPTTDARVIGADVDEIEALTGKFGRDVEEGIPQFSERSARRIQVGPTSAVFSYKPLSSSTCSIKAWTTDRYSYLTNSI